MPTVNTRLPMAEPTTRWADALRHLRAMNGAGVLVTVAAAKGSTPREAGAKMVVTNGGVSDTIGGGNLEFLAIEEAHELLADSAGRQQLLVEYPLGPKLGQCCGGNVTVLFERIDRRMLSWLDELSAAQGNAETAILITELGPDGSSKQVVKASQEKRPGTITSEVFARARGMVDQISTPNVEIFGSGPRRFLLERCQVNDFRIVLFGAGHVGRAVVAALAPLDCQISWVDCRPQEFPQWIPSNVHKTVSAGIVEEVYGVAAGSYFLVMTHSHQLDLELCERILKRDDFDYLGLIGSRSKRKKFLRRLTASGCSREAVQRLTCPIGVSGVAGKRPAEIAAAVAAQLLQVRARISATTKRDKKTATPIIWPTNKKTA